MRDDSLSSRLIENVIRVISGVHLEKNASENKKVEQIFICTLLFSIIFIVNNSEFIKVYQSLTKEKAIEIIS